MIDVRQSFLEFFKSKGHEIRPSAPLTPDDPTLLFTNAGMVPFKDIFTGKSKRPNPPRIATSQLCMRAGGKHNDLENVGFTRRHQTLFEMLGNFSFGDYFKEDAIKFAYEFLTQILKIEEKKLFVSVHEKDSEAFEIWQQIVPKERIKKMGDEDNFWEMGEVGACGYSSEIYYDQGDEFNSSEDYFGGQGDRFLEIWNLVFMEFERHKDGSLTPLPNKNIDTGLGLERISAILEGKKSNFDTHFFTPLIREVEAITNKKYSYEGGESFRVIADHARSTTFLLSQGVTFHKEGRGYVLRKILRRAVRHGYLLNLREPFLYKITHKVVEIMSQTYPYLKEKSELISALCFDEESKFFQTIERGIELFNREILALKQTKSVILSGEVAFKLYDTYGFPLDLTIDMLREENFTLNLDGFERCMSKQALQSGNKFQINKDEKSLQILREKYGKNEFVGYETLLQECKILAVLDENFKVLESSQSGWLLLDKTPFYAESGGQNGDCGVLIVDGDEIKISQTRKFLDLNLSKFSGHITAGKRALACVSKERVEIAKHHSATHLLHAALKKILGPSVSQAGSLVESKRLRFDFTHNKAINHDELQSIQDEVNNHILSATPLKVELMPLEAAKNSGACAQFNEKYDDIVRVVSFDTYSRELCGGTHVNNTSEIGQFIITKESSASSGVRRIEAICGKSAYEHTKALIRQAKEARELLRTEDILSAIEILKSRVKNLESKAKVALKDTDLPVKKLGDLALIVEQVDGDLKSLVDIAKTKHEKVAILLIDKNLKIVAGIKNCDIHAAQWLNATAEIFGGKGGGRADFATGGGKNASKVKRALEFALEYVSDNE